MTSQNPNGMWAPGENSSNQPWNYTALLSCNSNLDCYLRLKPRSEEQCFVSELKQRVKGESEKSKKDKERTRRMEEDLAGLDPITVEKSYPVKRMPTLLSLESNQPSRYDESV